MQIKLTTVKECEQLLDEMRSARQERLNAWQELSYWLCPWRGIFDRQRRQELDEERIKRFTGAAGHACLSGASGMTSGMTPRNIAWFKPEFTETALMDASGAREWLDQLDKLLKGSLNDGGFYQAIQSFNLDLIWAGCALLYSEKGKDTTLRYECVQIGTFLVALDGENRLDAVGREWEMTPRAMAETFGEENLSRAARADLERQPWRPRLVRCLVCHDGQGDMPVKSRYWEEGGDKFLRQSAFHEMPYFFASWNEGATPYGSGPGDLCLADGRQMDVLERTKLAGLAKLIDPPLAAPVSMKEDIDLSPGAINYVQSSQERLEPFLNLAPYAAALRNVQEEIAEVRKRLGQGLIGDIFASIPLEQRPANMTAIEYLERKREALQQLGPIISAYEPNVLIPMLMRQMAALDRAQLLPPLPDSLNGLNVFMKIEFISPMANALRQTSVESIRAFFQDVAQAVQATQNTQILDKIDLDQMIDELATGLGVPGSIIRSDEDVAKLREQQQQAQQLQMQMQLAAQQPQQEQEQEEQQTEEFF